MWINSVKEAKKKLGMSYREISIATNGKLSERDVMRLITGEYKKPFVDDVIALGMAVKLSPKDLFEEADIVVETTAAALETTEISNENEELSKKVEQLKLEIQFKDELLKAKNELLAHKDEIIGLYKKIYDV